MQFVELKPFANAKEIWVDLKEVEGITKQVSSYRSTVNQEYYIVVMRSRERYEITVDSAKNLLRVLISISVRRS